MLDKRLIKQLELASEQDTDTFYRKIAARDCAEKGSFTIEAAIALIGGYAGLAVVGSPIGILFGAALPVSWIAYKLWDGYEGLKEVESGNWVDRLPEREKQRYLKDKAAETKAIAPGAEQNSSDAAPPCSKKWTDAQWKLWKRIGSECPGIRSAIFAKVLVVSGPQQTGKSSLASAIAYCRLALLSVPVIAVTPHVDGKKIFGGLVVGAGQNFDEIELWYQGMVDGFSMNADRRTIVIDEITQYTGDHEKLGQNIIRTALSESDKHGYSPILINHAATVSAGFAGIKGVRELIDTSAAKIVRRYAKTAYGAQTRSPNITVALPGEDAIEVSVPEWFYLPKLQSMVPVSLPHTQDEAPEWLEQKLVQSGQIDTVGELNRLYQLDTDKSTPFGADDFERAKSPDLNSLPPELRAIADHAAKQSDWVTARECMASIRSLRGLSTDDIRGKFQQLANLNVGTVDGEGQSLKYRL